MGVIILSFAAIHLSLTDSSNVFMACVLSFEAFTKNLAALPSFAGSLAREGIHLFSINPTRRFLNNFTLLNHRIYKPSSFSHELELSCMETQHHYFLEYANAESITLQKTVSIHESGSVRLSQKI